MGPTSTLNFTCPSLGLSALGGGTNSACTDTADRVPDANCTTHSERLWQRVNESRIGRDSDGLRPSNRSNLEEDESVPRAAARRKVRSGRERVDVSFLGVMYCMMMMIVVFCMLFFSRRGFDCYCNAV